MPTGLGKVAPPLLSLSDMISPCSMPVIANASRSTVHTYPSAL